MQRLIKPIILILLFCFGLQANTLQIVKIERIAKIEAIGRHVEVTYKDNTIEIITNRTTTSYIKELLAQNPSNDVEFIQTRGACYVNKRFINKNSFVMIRNILYYPDADYKKLEGIIADMLKLQSNRGGLLVVETENHNKMLFYISERSTKSIGRQVKSIDNLVKVSIDELNPVGEHILKSSCKELRMATVNKILDENLPIDEYEKIAQKLASSNKLYQTEIDFINENYRVKKIRVVVEDVKKALTLNSRESFEVAMSEIAEKNSLTKSQVEYIIRQSLDSKSIFQDLTVAQRNFLSDIVPEKSLHSVQGEVTQVLSKNIKPGEEKNIMNRLNKIPNRSASGESSGIVNNGVRFIEGSGQTAEKAFIRGTTIKSGAVSVIESGAGKAVIIELRVIARGCLSMLFLLFAGQSKKEAA